MLIIYIYIYIYIYCKYNVTYMLYLYVSIYIFHTYTYIYNFSSYGQRTIVTAFSFSKLFPFSLGLISLGGPEISQIN